MGGGTLPSDEYTRSGEEKTTMLDDIKKTLWAAADKLRANMDAAEYKHIVLGMIFLVLRRLMWN